jgi:hypothetical protein
MLPWSTWFSGSSRSTWLDLKTRALWIRQTRQIQRRKMVNSRWDCNEQAGCVTWFARVRSTGCAQDQDDISVELSFTSLCRETVHWKIVYRNALISYWFHCLNVNIPSQKSLRICSSRHNYKFETVKLTDIVVSAVGVECISTAFINIWQRTILRA